MGELGQGEVYAMLHALKSGWQKKVQNVVKFAILCIAVTKAIRRPILVGNCMFLLVQIGVIIAWVSYQVPIKNSLVGQVISNIGINYIIHLAH